MIEFSITGSNDIAILRLVNVMVGYVNILSVNRRNVDTIFYYASTLPVVTMLSVLSFMQTLMTFHFPR